MPFPSCLNKETQKREIEFRGSQIVEIMFAIRETALQFCCPSIITLTVRQTATVHEGLVNNGAYVLVVQRTGFCCS